MIRELGGVCVCVCVCVCARTSEPAPEKERENAGMPDDSSVCPHRHNTPHHTTTAVQERTVVIPFSNAAGVRGEKILAAIPPVMLALRGGILNGKALTHGPPVARNSTPLPARQVSRNPCLGRFSSRWHAVANFCIIRRQC